MLVNLNIDLLRTFVTVVESGSFTRTADLLFRTQSAISLQMQKLENLAKTELLRRGNRQIELTSSGRLVYNYARRIVDLHDEMRDHIQSGAASLKTIRLGTPDDYAQSFLPKIFEAFSEWAPDIQMEIYSDISSNLKEMVKDGQLDLAIITTPELNNVENQIMLRQEQLRWVRGSNENIIRENSLPLALFPEGCIFRARAIEALIKTNQAFTIVHSGNSFSSLKAVLLANRAISVLAESTITPDLMPIEDNIRLPELTPISISIQLAPGKSPKALDILVKIITTVMKQRQYPNSPDSLA